MSMLYFVDVLLLCRHIFSQLYAVVHRHGTVVSQNFRSLKGLQVMQDMLKFM